MQEMFREAILRFALPGFVAAVVAFLVGGAFLRLWAQCRALNACHWALAASILFVAFTVGGTKTNGVNNLPPQQMTLPQPILQPLDLLPRPGAPVLLANPGQGSFAQNIAADWNICGAWKDSFWLPFADGWVFPWGTNHLTGVEVVSYGRLWPTPFDTNAVASAGAPFEIVPGLTSFAYELTPSNSYRFVWTDAAIGRDTNNLVTAELELFRSGDRSVATNGVATYLPRELPFPHDGFGQDAEWVAANFTNATEILSAGYPQWVDAQVGTDLTNGLYKLTVSVAEDPPETTFLFVGDLFVAVTNAGEYVFLLGKCIDYPLSVFPEAATNFTYTAIDDIAPVSGGAPLLGAPPGGWWSSDAQVVAEIVVPYSPMSAFGPVAHVKWNATLAVSPHAWFPTSATPSETFTAVLEDVPFWLTTAYAWHSSDPAMVSVAAPAAPVTQMTWLTPNAFDEVSLDLTVTVGSDALHAYFCALDEEEPVSWTWRGTMVKADFPATLFVNNDDDDAAEGVDCLQDVHAAKDEDVVRGRLVLTSDTLLEGVFSLDSIIGLTGAFAPDSGVYSGHDGTGELTEDWSCRVNGVFDREIYLNPSRVSTSFRDASVRVVWTPDGGSPIPFLRRFTVVEPVAEPVCNATTNVVENGVSHVYTVNPCGVVVGREAFFRIEVAPADYPDEKIVWSCEPVGVAEVLGDGTGRSVTVRGLSEGEATLSVQIGDSRSDPPTFSVRVVTNATVNVRAWIIEGKQLNTAFSADQVRQMVKDANDIYAQVGVTLNLVEPIVVTNIPDAYDALRKTATTGTSTWTYRRIADMNDGTDGLEVYFINRFVDAPGTLAVNGPRGTVVTRGADYKDFAHEIGHAFGMADVYIASDDAPASSVSLLPNEKVAKSRMRSDWNGGCEGRGSGGERYYAAQTSMSNIVSRLLMNGLRSDGDDPLDITNGDIYGVYYTNDVNDVRFWLKGAAPVGFPWSKRNPTHL